ncbi:MAG: ABC transporter permease [Planctomycetes bacterium]|nr:ABC transporter permease [Planctomycetota bacterium]
MKDVHGGIMRIGRMRREDSSSGDRQVGFAIIPPLQVQTFTDIVRYRFVLENLVAKNLKALYRNMALGFFWSILNPLVMAVVLTAVQLKFFGQQAWWPSTFLCALIPYNFFAYCVSGCANSVIGNASLVTKVRFPRQILPIAVIVTNLVHFAIQSTLVVAALLWFPPPHDVVGWHFLWLPVIVALNLALAVGLGLLVAGANVVYRDVQYIVDSVMTVLFWLCPLVYDAGPVLANSPRWQFWLYFLNPLSGLLDSYRAVLFWGRAPDLGVLALATVVIALLGVAGVRSFWKHEHRFADLI